jgi:hypothetical protein
LEDPVTRSRIGLAVAVLGLAGLVGLAGCGRLADRAGTTGTVEVSGDTSAEGVALTSMGFDTGEASLEPASAPTATPQPRGSAGEAPGLGGRRHALRVKLRKNVLHGETVVQTKDGVKAVSVQRGEVTAVTATSVTVRSTDGFTQTWTVGDKFTVVHDRTKVQPSDIKQGAQIGIAGTKAGGTPTARLAVLP